MGLIKRSEVSSFVPWFSGSKIIKVTVSAGGQIGVSGSAGKVVDFSVALDVGSISASTQDGVKTNQGAELSASVLNGNIGVAGGIKRSLPGSQDFSYLYDQPFSADAAFNYGRPTYGLYGDTDNRIKLGIKFGLGIEIELNLTELGSSIGLGLYDFFNNETCD